MVVTLIGAHGLNVPLLVEKGAEVAVGRAPIHHRALEAKIVQN